MEKDQITGLTGDKKSIQHRQKIFKGLLTQIPVIGPILTEYIPDLRINKMGEFLAQLNDYFEGLKDKIDEEYVKREDVICIVEKMIKSVTESYDKNKIYALKNGLINTVINKGIEVDRKDLYLSILNSLTPFHLKVLFLLYETERFVLDNKIDLATNVTSGRIYFFKQTLPKMTEDEIRLIVSDLVTKRLILNIPLTALGTQTDIDALKGFETGFGKEFMNFFTEPKLET